MNKKGFVIVRSVDDMKKYNAMGMDADFDKVRFRKFPNGEFLIVKELKKIVKIQE